jgi:hypothetical protein
MGKVANKIGNIEKLQKFVKITPEDNFENPLTIMKDLLG